MIDEGLDNAVDGVVTPIGEHLGGHAVAIVGVDMANRRVLVMNSWGTLWGDSMSDRVWDRGRMLPGQPMFRKRRQRKIHRTGEFTELGFDVFGYLQSDFGGFLDTLVPFVEARGLVVGGLVNERTGEVDLTVTKPDRGSVTREDIGAMMRFLAGRWATTILLVTRAYDVNWMKDHR